MHSSSSPSKKKPTLYFVLCVVLMMCVMPSCGPKGEDRTTTQVQENNEQTGQNSCGQESIPKMALVRNLRFVAVEEGITPGVDLDAVTTKQGEMTGCGHVDYTAPDGRKGIDNQFARLLPAVNAFSGEEAIDGLLQRTINSGNVLLMLDVRRVDDTKNDECTHVHLWRAKGQPIIDAQGKIEAGQTLDFDTKAPSTHVFSGKIEDGIYTAGPLYLELPLVVDNFDIFLTIHNATFRFTINDEGMIKGVLTGGVPLEDIQGIVEAVGGAGGTILDTIYKNITKLADLAPDDQGLCQQISVVLEFEAAPAYFFEDQEPKAPTKPEEVTKQ